jgi:L-histidine N-alpha-methyltransferase
MSARGNGGPALLPSNGIGNRLRIDVHEVPGDGNTLATDVLRGLSAQPKYLPSKYFYDDRGSRLFARICDLPEYYPTRTEDRLLRNVAKQVIALARPSHLVELGSGDARKTRILLDVLAANGTRATYVPLDVSEAMLRRTALALLEEYPWLRVHGIVGDYDHHLGRIPEGRRRLVLFLGSTLGNLNAQATAIFLRRVAAHLRRGDHFLLGTDLVKPAPVLEAAYNDAAGVTAAFNRNVLAVVNRELDADFELDAFEHLAFWNERASRVEMHLRAARSLAVRVKGLGRTFRFRKGETIQTEISRKYTRNAVSDALSTAGLRLQRWLPSEDGYFALSISTLRGQA